MSVRRGLLLLGAFKRLQRNQSVNKALCPSFKQHVRNSGGGQNYPGILSGGRVMKMRYFYRSFKSNEKTNKMVDGLMAVFWWWILWHLFTDYEEVIGPSYPDPSKWTDEELGIPSV